MPTDNIPGTLGVYRALAGADGVSLGCIECSIDFSCSNLIQMIGYLALTWYVSPQESASHASILGSFEPKRSRQVCRKISYMRDMSDTFFGSVYM